MRARRISGSSRVSGDVAVADLSGEVAQSFEGLLEELDELSARLLDQHKRELSQQLSQSRTLAPLQHKREVGQQSQSRRTLAPTTSESLASVASSDRRTLMVPVPADGNHLSPRVSLGTVGETRESLRVSHADMARKSSLHSEDTLHSFPIAEDPKVIKWCQSERFILQDSWRNKVSAAKLAEFVPEPKKTQSCFEFIHADGASEQQIKYKETVTVQRSILDQDIAGTLVNGHGAPSVNTCHCVEHFKPGAHRLRHRDSSPFHIL